MAAVPRRRRWGGRRVHKWLAVGGGAFLAAWVVTGVFITIPAGGRPATREAMPPVDYRTATLSPSDALARSGIDPAAPAAVRLERLGSRPVYVVEAGTVAPALIDARTGERVTIDAAEAARIATERYSGDGRPGAPERVERRSLRYFVGDVPAYRIAFDDGHGTEAYVSERTGGVSWLDRRSRTRHLMGAAHDLWPIGVVFGNAPRLLVMLGGALLAGSAILTGYYLALRRKRPAA